MQDAGQCAIVPLTVIDRVLVDVRGHDKLMVQSEQCFTLIGWGDGEELSLEPPWASGTVSSNSWIINDTVMMVEQNQSKWSRSGIIKKFHFCLEVDVLFTFLAFVFAIETSRAATTNYNQLMCRFLSRFID